jgi:hypothetical protein
MWSVNAGAAGCSAAATTVEHRTSSDGVHWSAPAPLAMRTGELWPWHLDVQWIPSLGEYWALFNGKDAVSCTTPALFLARSTDGVTWTTYDTPVLARGAIPELTDIVYRSTFEYDASADAVTLWYSGASYMDGRWIWRAATERRTRSALLRALTTTTANASRVRYPESKAPPLHEAP